MVSHTVMRQLTFISVLTLISMILFPVAGLADEATEAAGRIKARLVQIDALKASGDVGEAADGYLFKRIPLEPRQDSLVDSENADRRILYQSVSARTGQGVEDVGRQRALQIASRAREGVWLQKADGEWYQKP